MMKACEHIKNSDSNTSATTPDGCEECLETGDSWVHLRLCLECGHVGCCDNSRNKHATKHFHQTGHPVIKSFERGEDWEYCYIDDLFSE